LKLIGKPKLMRKINRELLISILREKQNITYSELIKITGLSRRTVNLIVESFKESGIVAEAGYGNSTSEGGKKPIIYKFVPNSFYAVGVMVRDLRAIIGICNLNGDILFEDHIIIEWDKGREHVSNQIIELVKTLIKRSKIDLSKFLGIGIGLPGIIDSKNGLVKTLTRHADWENHDLVNILKKKLKLYVEIKNENHIRVLGEKWFGSAKNNSNFVTIITTHDGIGAGIVINNKLVSSENCLLGEIGHIKVNNGKIKYKELKDFEYYLGLNHAKEVINTTRKHKSFSISKISKILSSGDKVSLDALFDQYNLGDKFSRIVVEEISKYFILLINIIVCTYDPELIIVQGKYSILENEFFENVTSSVKNSVYPQVEKKVVIKRSTRTDEMSILGAAGIVFDKVSL
jgi:N-acetylglucosamine repressor